MSAWAKIHDTIIDDPDFLLTAETGWIWARMLTVAARNADFGRIGQVRKIAHMLRETESAIVAAVDELGDRVQERDGELWFRDWCDWQTMTGKERAARHRGIPQAPVTNGNDAEPGVTARNGTNENDPLEERRGEESSAQPAAPVVRIDALRWQPLFAAVAESGLGAFKANGQPTALSGRIAGAIGPPSGDNPTVAAAMWRSFWASPEAEFFSAREPATSIATWLRKHPAQSVADASHDARFWFQSDSGAWALRDPHAAFGLAGVVADPDDPKTWPADVLAIYAADDRYAESYRLRP